MAEQPKAARLRGRTPGARGTKPAWHLDLATVHAQGVALYNELAVPADLKEIWRQAVLESGQGDLWPWIFAELYTIHRKSVLIEVRLRPAEGPNLMQCWISYEMGGALFANSASPAQLFQQELDFASIWYCTADFFYQVSEGRPVIALPLDLPLPPGGAPMGARRMYARGLKLAIEGDAEGLSPWVDLERHQDSVKQTVSFVAPAGFSPRLPRELFVRAVRVSNEFFRVGDTNSDNQPRS